MAVPTFNAIGQLEVRLYEELIRHPSLQFLAPMNEASGDILDRCVRNRLNMTVNASPTRSVDMGNGFVGITLNESTQYMNLSAIGSLNYERTDPFSFIITVKPNVSNTGALLATFNGTGINYGFTPARIVLANLYSAGGSQLRRDSDVAVTNGTLYQLGLTYDGSSAASGLILYRNGAVDASSVIADTLTTSITGSDAALHIGRRPDNSDYLGGTIGFVAIFNAVLTPREMKLYAHLGGFL